jgi:hypothetical protein
MLWDLVASICGIFLPTLHIDDIKNLGTWLD